jgi:glutathionylspermidine synthase
MKRHTLQPRVNWQEKAEEIGFTYHTSGTSSKDGEGTYWDESVAYEFSMAEIDELEDATRECQLRCLDAVDKVVGDSELMAKIGIPSAYHSAISKSWKQCDPSLYGRFDFAYTGDSQPKMLEYNADTPTMVIESALMQWFWLQDVKPGKDQFNSLHEKLIDQFKEIRQRVPFGHKFVFAGYSESLEEYQTLVYFQDLATQAGLTTDFIDLGDIGWNGENFTDIQENPIKYWFKLYPWEWMMGDEFGLHTIKGSSGIVEPIWKSILSNKGILPILHEMFPDHPNILPASFTEGGIPVDDWDWLNLREHGTPEQLEAFSSGKLNPTSYVVKPMLSREGANIDIVESGVVTSRTTGMYDGPRIYQKKADLFQDGDNRAVIGSWVVGNEPAGIIIRDHDRPIVLDTSRVVPHWIE